MNPIIKVLEKIYKFVRKIYKRYQIYKQINRLETIKLNGIRKKYGLHQHWNDGIGSHLQDICLFPIVFVFTLVIGLYNSVVTALGSAPSADRRQSHMSFVFKNGTDENKVFRKVVYFIFGLILAFLTYLFLSSQELVSDTKLISMTIIALVVFALIAPFKEIILCLTLIALPSILSSKLRFILVAIIVYAVLFKLSPNITANVLKGVSSAGCSVWGAGKGGKDLVISNIKQHIQKLLHIIQNTYRQIKRSLKKFNEAMKRLLQSIDIRKMCKQNRMNKFNKKCINDMHLSLLSVDMTPVFICDAITNGAQSTCQSIKQMSAKIYNQTIILVNQTIEEILYDLYVDIELNHELNHSINISVDFDTAVSSIGRQFWERHYILSHMSYLANIRIIILIIITFWIFIMSVIYLIMFKKSDPWDNVYIDEEFMEIDKKRSDLGKETVLPLTLIEQDRYVSTFDITMTRPEMIRFFIGFIMFSYIFGQLSIYFIVDYLVNWLIHLYNSVLDIFIEVLSPSSFTIKIEGQNLMAHSMRGMQDSFDIKEKMIKKFESCKAVPNPPNVELYKKMSLLLLVVLMTVFCGSYGLRLRHYVAGLFYPHRIPVRTVWLYNHILITRGNIFEFWRKQMRQKTYGDIDGPESVSLFERLCHEYKYLRIICTVLGVYEKQVSCVVCGIRVKDDGSDQSISCVNKCGAYYCFDCLGGLNNICINCMNTIDYINIGDISEEMDSSDEDIPYTLDDEDFLYQYNKKKDQKVQQIIDYLDDTDQHAYQRRDLVSIAYQYDTKHQMPKHIYIVNNKEDESHYETDDDESYNNDSNDYNKYLFSLEKQLRIPAEDIVRMKTNAKNFMEQEINTSAVHKVKEDMYSHFRREDDQRLITNALLYQNRDQKSQQKYNKM
ncbi:DC-STAMP domain-containing protein 2-like [Oppia nitens]|uniref:DC-STAMP domain-containing protein 2-like n=1 Tax=Oppia nitens TaxID=1686743 RepID=UPI0023DC65DD|nr:DC-STAMP domain-containing protein 2-like [Oppia nitens]